MSLKKLLLNAENEIKVKQLECEMDLIQDDSHVEEILQLKNRISRLESDNHLLNDEIYRLRGSLKTVTSKNSRNQTSTRSFKSSSSCETLGENEGKIQLSKLTNFHPNIKVIMQRETKAVKDTSFRK